MSCSCDYMEGMEGLNHNIYGSFPEKLFDNYDCTPLQLRAGEANNNDKAGSSLVWCSNSSSAGCEVGEGGLYCCNCAGTCREMQVLLQAHRWMRKIMVLPKAHCCITCWRLQNGGDGSDDDDHAGMTMMMMLVFWWWSWWWCQHVYDDVCVMMMMIWAW